MTQAPQPIIDAADSVGSIIEYDGSQDRFFNDPARIAIANWHRRKGKDYVSSGIAVDDATQNGKDWWIVGMTQAQADETHLKVKQVIESYKAVLQMMFGTTRVDEDHEEFRDYDPSIDHAFKAQAHSVIMPNGARVTSLPGRNPDTLAGRGGSMIWTEFGLWDKGGYDHWRTLYPIITRGGHKLRIISTPRGKNTKYYEICTGGRYSYNFCDIHKSVFEDGYQIEGPDGQPLDVSTDEAKAAAIEWLRQDYGDEAGWIRDYLCQFSGDLSSLVTWAELERAAQIPNPHGFAYQRFDDESGSIAEIRPILERLRGKRLGIGWDVARRGHLSPVAVNVLDAAGRPSHLAALITMRNCTFDFMRSVAMQLMDLSHANTGFGDATGMGMESNEALHKRYGDRWTPFTFGGASKREVASAIKTAFNDGTQSLPPMDGPHKFIATDIYAIQKDDTGANLVIDEMPNPLLPESHCDIGYAIGLATLAGARNAIMPVRTPLARKPAGW